LIKILLMIILNFFILSFAQATIGFSQFDLKPHQLRLLKKQESLGKGDAYLLSMARGFVLYNTTGNSSEHPEQEYIPPHSLEDLMAIQQWAKGAALFSFLEYTEFEFLGEVYRSDCPNWALFNFGRATGTIYLKLDVLQITISLTHELQQLYLNDPEIFNKKYKEIIVREGFRAYFN
jgi:hypothetical protein